MLIWACRFVWEFLFGQKIYFYFQKSLVENVTPSLQCQWALFGANATQFWSQFPWTTYVTAYCVHSLVKATSMQRKDLTGGEMKGENSEPLKKVMCECVMMLCLSP